MKKLLSIILVLTMALSFASCGSKETVKNQNQNETVEKETEKNNDISKNDEESVKDKGDTEEKNDKTDKENPQQKPNTEKNDNSLNTDTKPQEKPQTQPSGTPETKPEAKPETKPEAKPEAKPENKPQENKSVGNVLLADFKAKAAAHSGALSLAEALVANPVIEFSGAAMSVEEGYLTGFGNAEIKGFKEGAMFAPMIGTIPFVGYVFTLENADKASDFIAQLKKNANLRWNICTEADEMITGNVGNKVFFVMSPVSFEQ